MFMSLVPLPGSENPDECGLVCAGSANEWFDCKLFVAGDVDNNDTLGTSWVRHDASGSTAMGPGI